MTIELEGKVFEVPATAFEDARVTKLLKHLNAEEHMTPEEAKSFVDEILSGAFKELGETYLGEMKAHIERVQELRTELRTKYDAVLEKFKAAGGKPVELPPELRPASFGDLFDALDMEIEKMKPPEEALKGAVDEAKATAELKEGVESLPPEHPAAGLTEAEWNAEIDKLFEEWGDTTKEQLPNPPENLDVARVKGGKAGDITIRKRPWAKRADLQHVELLPGETPRQALARVRQVLGRKISGTPLGKIWNDVRAAELKKAGVESVEQLGRERALKAYDNCRNAFWERVLHDPEARDFLDNAGFNVEGGAPELRMNDPNGELSPKQREMNLDHLQEKAAGDNWKLALDADNLQFELGAPNSFRDSVQRRLKIGAYAE